MKIICSNCKGEKFIDRVPCKICAGNGVVEDGAAAPVEAVVRMPSENESCQVDANGQPIAFVLPVTGETGSSEKAPAQLEKTAAPAAARDVAAIAAAADLAAAEIETPNSDDSEQTAATDETELEKPAGDLQTEIVQSGKSDSDDRTPGKTAPLQAKTEIEPPVSQSFGGAGAEPPDGWRCASCGSVSDGGGSMSAPAQEIERLETELKNSEAVRDSISEVLLSQQDRIEHLMGGGQIMTPPKAAADLAAANSTEAKTLGQRVKEYFFKYD